LAESIETDSRLRPEWVADCTGGICTPEPQLKSILNRDWEMIKRTTCVGMPVGEKNQKNAANPHGLHLCWNRSMNFRFEPLHEKIRVLIRLIKRVQKKKPQINGAL